MTVVKHGVSTSTPERRVYGAGVVYIDYYDPDSPGTVLGATLGGNTLEIIRNIRDTRPDGAKGPVKGFRRIESVDVKLTCQMLEITAENLRRALAKDGYGAGTSDITNEAVGDGDGSETKFDLDHGLILENSDVVTVNASAVVRGTDYTIDYDNGELQFFSAPTDGHAIVCSYTYVSGEPTMTGEEVTDNAYCDNVTLLLDHTGFAMITAPLEIKLSNVLCVQGLKMEAKSNEEVIPEIVFEAHYSDSDLATEPWQITYPS